jgi:SAM-dependent methyltransferase
MTVLEVGCGTGSNIWYLAREGFQVYGIDGSAVAIEYSRNILMREGLQANLRIGDVMKLPYEDNFFDAVFDIECIYANSMKDSRTILQEIKRVLKIEGQFFSQTFMTGMSGDGSGTRLEGELNTYVDLTEGPLKHGYGIIRFTSENDVKDLYSIFDLESLDYTTRTDRNRTYEIREWLIACRKRK